MTMSITAQQRNTFSVLFWLVITGACSTNAKQPHILFILADDLGWHDVGYHDSEISTPTLDQLASDGVKLENYYVQPICSPTRSQLLTGRYQVNSRTINQSINRSINQYSMNGFNLLRVHDFYTLFAFTLKCVCIAIVFWHGNHVSNCHTNYAYSYGEQLHQLHVWCHKQLCTNMNALFCLQIHLGLQHGVIRPSQPNGVPLEYPTIADKLKENGYSTHIVGKWHIGFYKKEYTPTYRGFDSFFGMSPKHWILAINNYYSYALPNYTASNNLNETIVNYYYHVMACIIIKIYHVFYYYSPCILKW